MIQDPYHLFTQSERSKLVEDYRRTAKEVDYWQRRQLFLSRIMVAVGFGLSWFALNLVLFSIYFDHGGP